MTTIYSAAVKSYQAAADVLVALQEGRMDLVPEINAALVGRPKLALSGGYNAITNTFGACLPDGTRCDVLGSTEGNTVELRSSGLNWMTLEATLPSKFETATRCYVECEAGSDFPLVADVFVRNFAKDGSVEDAGHVEWHIRPGSLSLCRIDLPEFDEAAAERRVIVHLRQPSHRLLIGGLCVTLV
ncbi:hypothetical protein RGQ15_01215 [Paracoccus sp. MBLB3053]|uniref:Uncharacterized protein n=1 Tax=Paracoccus aurantius TaxID=3073814 RepID=A0ABU2HME6_9RHOB|nr:hypothetical protein [Paracoccus sp. MBLB3053]MDS9466199.1 hypothetical protein [Paracoccus sp. MBLB3053]